MTHKDIDGSCIESITFVVGATFKPNSRGVTAALLNHLLYNLKRLGYLVFDAVVVKDVINIVLLAQLSVFVDSGLLDNRWCDMRR